MPWALAAAAVTAGTALYSGSQANKAADKALNAQNQNNAAALAQQQAALDRITQLQNPYVQAGYGGLSQLQSQYGYGGGTPAQTPAANSNGPQPAMGGATPVNGGDLARVTAGGGAYAPPGGAPGAVAPQGPAATPQQGATPTSPNNPYTGGVQLTTPGTPGSAGGPDWRAYLAANPDVAAWAAAGHGDPSLGANQTPEQAAAYQYANTGQAEGRAAPGALAATPGTPGTTQLSPADQALAGAIGNRPDFAPTPDFGKAPQASQFFGNFHEDPGYQFALNQGLRADNASYGARGLLKSDAAVKGLNDYAQGMANQQYGNWWNRQNSLYTEGLGQYNQDRSANYNIFNTDRNFANNNFEDTRTYATNRYDNTANNLFRMVGLGTGAAASVGGANTNYANQAGQIYGSNGTNAANAAYNIGANNAQTAGAIGGAISSGINLYNGNYGGTPMNVQSYTNPIQLAAGQNPYMGTVNSSLPPTGF